MTPPSSVPPPPSLSPPCGSCRAGFPPGPPGDQSLGLLSDPLGFISRLRREHGPVVGLLLGGERVVLVADPDAAKQVSTSTPHSNTAAAAAVT